MNLNQLRVLVALINRGSYTAAAEQLHLSQPAVSQQIKALETACGVPVVERVDGKIVPTYAGEVLYRYAQSMLHIEEEAQHALAGIKAGVKGRFVVGANTTGGMYITPPLIAAYRKNHPETEIIFRIEGTESLLAALANRLLDLAIVGGPVTDKKLKAEPILPDRVVLITSPHHPLSSRQQIRAQDLANERFIIARYGSTTRRLIESRLRHKGVNLHIAMEMAGTEDIKKAVEAGLGVAMVSQWSVLREVAAGHLRQIEIVDLDIRRDYVMVTNPARYYTPAAEDFMDFVRQYAPQLKPSNILKSTPVTVP
ncbi:transcriptional regulator, LysR family [Thermobaculum terrenum ATCC BAA-798]|uniref:Transcriptional regulator, LysR family n=1 Tax=Thermobaculum terrenum (strain ATCC BAA-798 / CCMEE 7001 / YNP1) TaxID=525904 RepID=D1CCM2_THET1|nr:LysR substrate-binding domain-containing protein [Thermobaculum terrenum]ACZ42537.1 transcriptional regulator, LysR family [Thermobaculum terrenum ATCC BAA-798]